MFTRCTECRTLQEVTTEQLRAGHGMVRCKKKKCLALFNALESISDTDNPETPIATTSWLSPQEKAPEKPYWLIGSLIGLTVLFAQLSYFEGLALPQNPTFRPWLEKFCGYLTCQLPTYRNTKELTVLQGALTTQTDESVAFSAVISNQAAFEQAYPKLKLTLLDYAGLPFSQRVFQPYDYLPKESAAPFLLLPDATSEISLSLAAPKTKIGGYTFEFTD